MLKIFGFDPGRPELTLQDCLKRIHGNDRKGVRYALEKAMKEGGTYEAVFRIVLPDGTEKNIHGFGHAVLDHRGEPCLIRGTGQDITKRILAEKERKQLEIHLQQAHKMEAIGTLAGGIAHDFNNMLGIIAGNVSYARSIISRDDELYDILSDIQLGTKQAQKLTQQLLTFAKGGAPVKNETDINRLIQESARFANRGAKSKCRFDFADDLYSAEVDEGQINQVIQNLVINANQAMPQGGIINIKTRNIKIEADSGLPLSTGRYIKMTIDDQGTGISKKHLPNIFDPFFTTKQRGSGLGLSTSYSIIQKHNGCIMVYSTVEKGTVFHIYLPAILKESRKMEDNAKDMEYTGHGRILIMDDQEAVLRMAGRILNRLGYEAMLAMDGAQAVEIYREALRMQRPFDLVILDLTVPGGMGGARTITELLRIDSNVKAVVSSGYSNDPIMANYEDYGFCGIIPKPYTREQMAAVLKKWSA
jgi:signal transduction histidine kinase/ActR/RegA family two-component response regulator